jgi:anti-sigma factor (TIGR02949 family)
MTDLATISCEEALRRLFEALDHELADESRREFERHLAHCRSCFSRFEFETRLKAHLAQLGSAPVRAELHQRIRAVLDTFEP